MFPLRELLNIQVTIFFNSSKHPCNLLEPKRQLYRRPKAEITNLVKMSHNLFFEKANQELILFSYHIDAIYILRLS